ncbi:twin-arginine translocation pathway signal sequence domain-containing protein [Caballeronia temeraria]|uniref:Twin-arginine translocation pathway signal sequence domain-containing protein n=1 Tax=Caballeronia temeraria TaxID=1777137 RepID=A0A158B119_9BURK|nr:DUF1501 domain-containing protein [Caballeronia temeraria]SAK63679.1 twin-arginine translocation pathway signal sequence domain-containing protein [Caballeronia temeraria]
MNRRQFLSIAGAFAGCAGNMIDACAIAHFNTSPAVDSLVLVDLDGGNDALNTVIPIADPRYRALRPTLAIPNDHALMLDEHTGLHPSLRPLMSAWRAKDLAIVQGIGYDAPNRSHYRSRQIWDTASHADEYRTDGWLDHVNGVHARGIKVTHITLHGFDTHEHQLHRHAALLAELGECLASLRASLIASGAWRRTLVMTRSEFGRAARENAAGGTEHGAAAAHFVMGGCVRGGLYGTPPRLDRLDADGGLSVDVDFRRLYATVLDACGQNDCIFEPLPIIRV